MDDSLHILNGATRLPLPPDQNWLAALRWEIAPTQSKSELRRRATQEGATHFLATSFSESELLACWVQVPKSEKKAPISAALAVAHQLTDDCYAVFELQSDVYWFVANCKGQLSVLSDKVGNKESMLAAVTFFLSMNKSPHKWHVIAPVGFFEDREADPTPLIDFTLSSSVNKLYNIPSMSLRRPVQRYSLIALAIVGVIVGTHIYQGWKEDKALQIAKLQLKENIQAQKPVLPPWPSLPDAPAIIQGNGEYLIPLSVAGWMLESKTYTRQSDIALIYRRTGNASVADFRRQAQELFGKHQVDFNIPGGADQATVTLPISVLAGSGQQKLIGLTEAMLILTTFAQRQNAQLQLDPQPNTRLIDGENITLPWREVRFTLILPISPDIYIDSLPMPGLRIARIRTVREGVRLSYTLEGTLYANP